ncbi:Rieske (2Fe-2S) protein [Solicola sp. PLA-1-18]|uniref:Rieske (2Fe-2S) protein n=1 Tax=Solicola sp. PLA-1-18 TaxID=3380532 RepID=UPI003B7E0740
MERTAPTDSTDIPESTDSTAVRRLHPRRTVLRGVAAAGGVGVLAACSGGSDDTGSGGSSDSGSGSGGGETSAAPAGTELGPASEVQVAGGKIYEEQKVVVTQPTQGAYKAFSAVCTHQGCLVSEIVENAIVCKCHNSEFSIEDGSVITGPASQALAEQPVTVANDVVTLG